MNKCPACKSAFMQRKNGRCPVCNTELQLREGVYYRADIGSPNAALFRKFEDLVSTQLSAQRGVVVPFRVSKKTPAYNRELAVAERLLQAAEYDYDLAVAALGVLFNDKGLRFKTRSSLLHCEKDWPVALAIARSLIAQEAAKTSAENELLARINAREDLFS